MTPASLATTAPQNASQILQPLNWRYATKKFDASKEIPNDTWYALEQSLVLAPSSFGLQPWKFFVIRNPDLRKQLQAAAWGQSQVVDASHLVVFAIKQGVNAGDVDPYLDRAAEPLNHKLPTQGNLVRISAHVHNTEAEIVQALGAIASFIGDN